MSSAVDNKKESGLGGLVVAAGILTCLALLFNKKHSVPNYKLPELEYDGAKVRENWKRVLKDES